MTIRTKRRGRRSLAAIAAALLMASVLAVVAGAPAQAANTSFEVKHDHDDNAATMMVREFAGQDRYDTALRVAANFARSKGGLGAVPTAFVASGETLVDSISVAGLAGYADAPILLTPTGSLHGGVADFIEDYGVSTVYVLGGMAAVSDATVTAIEGLSSNPMVERVAGDDRYATAAKVSAMIDADSSWCGTGAVSAVLINGSTDMLAYGVAVQTIAFRLQLPVLMTAADELSMAAADFIEMNDVEHVQIIGGTGAVSADVASALTTLGVDTVERTPGDSAAAVSVELAKKAANGCSDSLGLVSADRVALVRGNPDGVVAAPMLASSFAGGYMVPPLIVDDSLPAAVRDYLAATPKMVGANKLNLGIVAVGGTAAVSQATMDAALDAAASSGALSASIAGGDNPDALADGSNPDEGDTNGDGTANVDDPVRPGMFVSLYFSDDVPDAGTAGDAANDALLAMVRDVLEINGAPAQVTAVSTTAAGGSCQPRRVTVSLGTALMAGDTVSVTTSAHKFGRANDQRTLVGSSAMVQAAPADRTRPTVQVIGIAEASTPKTAFKLRFADAGGFPAMETAAVGTAHFTFVRASGSEDRTISTAAIDAAVEAGAKMFEATVTLSGNLAAGDRLVVKPGIVKDSAGNLLAGTSGTAIRAQASPRISAILMSELKHSMHNSWTIPTDNPFGDPLPTDGTAALTISAKASGPAAGAAGNDWDILLDTASGYMATKPLDIDVRVDTRGKRVTIRWVNGKATVGNLLEALRAESDFDQHFAASINPCSAPLSTPLVHTDAGRNALATSAEAGRTQFAIEVRFNAYIDTVDSDELLEDLLAAAATRANTTNDDDGIRAATEGDGNTPAGGGLALGAGDQSTTTDRQTQVVRYEGETALVKNLPMARDLVETAAGIAESAAGTDAVANPAIAAVAAVATGYAADAPTAGVTETAEDKVDEDKNAMSQRRIAVSNNVKAR